MIEDHIRIGLESTAIKSKDGDRQKIDRDIETFLANGGGIEEVPPGKSKETIRLKAVRGNSRYEPEEGSGNPWAKFTVAKKCR